MNKAIIFMVAALMLSACSNDTPPPTETTADVMKQSAVEHAGKHADPKYVCPMHPQIIRDEPGNCPICGMDLVPVEQEEMAGSGERKILYYRHPHNPAITSDAPRKDEMGMDFVPIYEEGGTSVKISPAVVQNMGVRTAVVERDKLWRRIDTVGYVDFDENRLSHIHLRIDGWIEKLAVKSEGERVSKSDVLFELYSPTLVNAQEEYLQALASGSQRLASASRERLRLLGVAAAQIDQLEKSRKVQQKLQIFAPQDGIVARLNVREGMFVKPATEVMMLADLSTVWLLAEVFESQSDWVRVGAPAEVKLSYLPGREWQGRVEYVYPSLDPKTRTLKVRLRFDNPDEDLKPNMFADVVIFGGARKDILVIPREALIRTGDQDRVILAMGEGRFKPRKVTAGMESGDWVEIQHGLREGDRVVISGQFLIDSEASLKASIQRMSDASSELVEESTQPGGMGVLKKIMPDEGKLNMVHDPIPEIGWPSMTMDFRVKDGVSLEGLQPEDHVMFELEKTEDGYIISNIHKHRM
jgi:Cu(I)/Ag(I) efflux system membrane fusion protein